MVDSTTPQTPHHDHTARTHNTTSHGERQREEKRKEKEKRRWKRREETREEEVEEER